MDEQAAMPASSASYMNAADFIRQLPAAPCGICSTTSLREADQAHGIPSERSGKAVYKKQLQQLQTDHEEPNLELSLGNGHLHNVDVQGRTFLYSKAQEMQRQRAAAAYPISSHIPVEVPLRSPNEFGYRVESRGGVLQQAALAFCRPTAAAPPPIIGSTSTTTISYAKTIAHPPYRAIMGTMAPRPRPPPLMMMSSMGPPRLPETLGPTAAQAQRSVISTPFPIGRPLPYLPGDVSLRKYYVHFLLLELLQLFMSHQIRTGADRRLCIPLSFHVVMIQSGMYVVMSFVLVSNM